MTIPQWDTSFVPLLEHEASKNTGRKGLNLGLPKLSNTLEGFEKGELIVLTAPPGQGKTQLARTVALNFIQQGLNVVYCTYELTLSQLANLFKISGLEAMDNKYLLLAPKEHIEKDILFIEKLMEANKENLIDCIIIDDFHALEEKYAHEKDNMLAKMNAIAGKLKELAQKYNCVVITMVQQRKDAIRLKDNSLGDIAYSGRIAQVADTVLAIRSHAENQAIIEIIKSRWAGSKSKIKVESVNKVFMELDIYHEQTPADVVNSLYGKPSF
jgi:replicative DNA helicase